MALATLRPRIWYDLPVPVERLAFRESCNNHRDEGESEEPTNELETDLIRPPPYLSRQSLEKFRNGKFGYPETVSISALAQQSK